MNKKLMQKYRILTAAALLLTAGAAVMASPLTPEKAVERAAGLTPRHLAGPDRLRLAETRLADDIPALYLFEATSGEGFVVLSADDCVTPLLGYSERGQLRDKAGNRAPAFEWWLDGYAAQVAHAATNSDASRETIRRERPEREPVATLCTTRWNQGDPYNMCCPKQGDSRTYTGCVATSMAQVMKYFNWPEHGEGQSSYNWRGKLLRQNYEKMYYDWDRMLDRYDENSSEESRKAVGELMYSAGVSVEMDYGLSASGAITNYVGVGLTSYFRYDKSMRYLERDYYELDEWETIIYENLRQTGPVIYGGQSIDGGHSFVCDGDDADGYFHFNWGWGGVSDGYYLLDLLDPIHQGIGGASAGFTYMQDAVVGIKPDTTGDSTGTPVFRMRVPFTLEQTEATRGDVVRLGGQIFNPGPLTMPDPTIALQFRNVGTGEKIITEEENVGADVPPVYAFGDITLTIPYDVPDGEYIVSVVYHEAGEEEFREVETPVTGLSWIRVDIQGDVARLSDVVAALPEVGNFSVSGETVAGSIIGIEATLKNETDSAMFALIVPVLMTSEGSVVNSGAVQALDFAAEESLDYSDGIGMTDFYGRLLPEGDYTLYLCAYSLMNYIPLESKEIRIAASLDEMRVDACGEAVRYYTPDGLATRDQRGIRVEVRREADGTIRSRLVR